MSRRQEKLNTTEGIVSPGPEGLPKVVLVDDELPILNSLKREFRDAPAEFLVFNDPLQALEAVKSGTIAMIITDNRMPGMTGIQLLEQVKRISPDTSRIVLTGYTDLDSAVQAINEGEVNYFISKPWEAEELHARFTQGLEKYHVRRKISQSSVELDLRNRLLEMNNAELKDLAQRDPLTRLLNRAEFSSNLEAQIKLFARDRQPFCLAMGDIDHFKRINDTYGHPVGDEVIVLVADTLSTTLRDTIDSTYRYGGEEFAVIMRNTQLEHAVLVMNRLIEKIASVPITMNEAQLAITMSMGVCQYEAGWGAESLVKRADEKLYAAKQAGRNRVIA